MALFTHLCVSVPNLCTPTPHTQTHRKRLRAESQGRAFPPSLPFSLSLSLLSLKKETLFQLVCLFTGSHLSLGS